MKNSHIILLLCLLSFFLLNAQDKYAAPTLLGGSPLNDGSILSPWDLQTGLDNIVAGETLWLRGGTETEPIPFVGRYHNYNSEHGSASNPITVSSFPGEWAVIDGNIESCENAIPQTDYNTCSAALTVYKDYWEFKNFEITFRGTYTRFIDSNSVDESDEPELEFNGCSGIGHNSGRGCKFTNLIIHEMPSNGMGSWKSTNDTEIYGCLIYNNGNEYVVTDDDGNQHRAPNSGTGIYIQNLGPGRRTIKNNIFFNNFKVGAKLWSASSNPPGVGSSADYLQNLDFDDNVILNSGSPINEVRGRECFIIAGASEVEGEALVHDVNVRRNFMYHNKGNAGIHAEVFRIGTEEAGGIYINYAYDVKVLDNYFIGRKEGVRIIRVDSIGFEFKRNYVQSDFVYSVNNTDVYSFNYQSDRNINKMRYWDFDNNSYFSKNGGEADNKFLYSLYNTEGPPNPNSGKRTLDSYFTNPNTGDYSYRGVVMDPPEGEFGFETNNSTNNKLQSNYGPFYNSLKDKLGDEGKEVISIVQNKYNPNRFHIVAFDYNSELPDVVNDVILDLDLNIYNIPIGMKYTLRDAENYFDPIVIESVFTGSILLDMNLPQDFLDYPNGNHNPDYPAYADLVKKSDPQIGVFILDFIGCEEDLYLAETESSDINYQASNSITCAGNGNDYIVLNGVSVNHVAGNSISLLPGFHAKHGSKYNARIESCNANLEYVGENNNESRITSNKYSNKEKNTSEVLKVFPNPTINSLTIKSEVGIEKWELKNQLNNLLMSKMIHKENVLETTINLSSRINTGIYYLTVKLKNGETITKQIIKN